MIIFYFLEGCLFLYFVSILFSVIVTFLDFLGPKIIQYTVDYCIADTALEKGSVPSFMETLVEKVGGREFLREHLVYVAAAVAAIAVAAAICRYLMKLINSFAAEKFVRRMRDKLFEHIMELPFSWHSENHTGDIIQRCTSDVDTIKMFISEQLHSLVRILIRIVVAVYFMLGINKTMTLISATFIPVIVLYSCFFHNKIRAGFEKADAEEGRLSATAHILAAFWASNDLISGLQVMMITIFGAVFCVRNYITVGEYIAFVAYNAMLTWPVRALGRIISEMSKARVAIDRIGYIINSEAEKDIENAVEPDMRADIRFENVSYRYENGSDEVVNNISFTIKAGSTVGILGGTGSGKSTLMYLLDRLYKLPKENGSIYIGDTNIADIKAKYLRKNIGLVLQEPFLFSGTLSENIGITKKDPDMKEIREAARIAALDDTILSFNKGYDTYVGERGVTLSGGQKQRTAIAQMLMSKPPVMIFDDSLSAVDTETDIKIRKALSENSGDSTVIIISHRITTLMHADNIIVLDKGNLVQMGSHDSLVRQEGMYKKIYDIQTQGI